MRTSGASGRVPLYRRRRITRLQISPGVETYEPMLVMGSGLCAGRRFVLGRWTPVAVHGGIAVLEPPCRRPRLWSVDFAWPGQSVGQLLIGTGHLLPTA